MHFNITYGLGADLPASQPAPQAGLGVREAEEGVIERSHGVSFSEVVEDREPSAPPPPPGYAGGTGAWGEDETPYLLHTIGSVLIANV